MSGQTNVFENKVRRELLSRIEEYPTSYNELLAEKFGITDSEGIPNLSISKLTEIADFLDDIFL